jgi:hypothetical protein
VKVRYRNPGDDRLKRVAEILARSTSGLWKSEARQVILRFGVG